MQLTEYRRRRNFWRHKTKNRAVALRGGPLLDQEVGLKFGQRLAGAWAMVLAIGFSAPALAQGADGRAEKLTGSLETFCIKWMGFLEQREMDNKKAIAWREVSEGVEGEFVGYDKKYTCALSELRPDTKTPVGTIKYLEFKYRHQGSSSSEALVNRPKIIEATEVTEIFRYSQNQWVY